MIKNIDPLMGDDPKLAQESLKDIVGVQEFMPEIANPADDPLPEEETPEGVEVAGWGKVAAGVLKEATKAKRTPERPDLVANDPKPMETIETPPEAPQAPKMPEPYETPVTGKPPERIFNLDQINDSDSLRQHIEYVAEQAGATAGKVNFKQLAKEIDEMGYSPEFVQKVINVNERLNADPGEVRKMMNVLVDAGRRSLDLANKVDEAAENGTLNSDLLTEFQQAVAFEGAVSRGVKLKQADVARSLAILNQARTSKVNRAAELDKAVETWGTPDDVVAVARMYQSGKGGELSHNIAEGVYKFRTRFKDVAMSTWINGLLSSPVTHFKNMFANAMFSGLNNIFEYGTASLIGKARNIVFNSQDRIMVDDVMLRIRSLYQGNLEGLALSWEALKKNKQITGASKVETGQVLDPFNIEVGEGSNAFQKFWAKGLGIYGKAITAPGRALMAEDEYFKAVNYRAELNYLAQKKARDKFLELTKDKDMLDPSEIKAAEEFSIAEAKRVLSGEDMEAHKQALDYAGEMTFTKDMEGTLRVFEKAINKNPIYKIIAPFFRTPVNIAIELNKRLPTGLISPSVIKEIQAGGVRRDLALAKVSMGSSIVFGLSAMVGEERLTGAGPFSVKQRQLLEKNGWQPYSFVYDRSEITSEKAEALRKYTTVLETEDKVYISYAGLEPIGALVGMSATLGEYTLVSNDDQTITDLSMGLAAGAGDYLSELPVVAGLSELMNSVSGKGADPEKYFENFIQKSTTQIASAGMGMTPLGAYSSLSAYAQRVLDPEKRLAKPDIDEYDDLNPLQKGWYDALAKSNARSVFTGDEVERQLDPITGEIREYPESALARAFFMKVSKGKGIPAYDVMYMLDVPDQTPPRKMDGIELTGPQYNRYIELMTQTPIGGKTLSEAVGAFKDDTDFLDFAESSEENAVRARDVVVRVISDYRSMAKDMLKAENLNIAEGEKLKKEKAGAKILPKIEAMRIKTGT